MQRDLPDHVVRPQVSLGDASDVGDEDRVDRARRAQRPLEGLEPDEHVVAVVPGAAAGVLHDIGNVHE